LKVLLTGASSFTGVWFAQALSSAGHQVVAPVRGRRDSYEGVRAERVRVLESCAEVVWDCAFGDERFATLAAAGADLLCHHAAQVGDYRSADFDIAGAVAANTRNLRAVLRAMQAAGPCRVLHTGSVFEQDEGAGTLPLRAFSAYGLSKGLTAQVVAHQAGELGVAQAKFVIPNPFGPLEEPRFCAYLMRCWKDGRAAEVKTPAYVRDNIHVGLLAAAYVDLAERLATGTAPGHLGPSGYVEQQGAFTERFAREMRARTNLACEVVLPEQAEFGEPMVRINVDPALPSALARPLAALGWNEPAAWDAIAAYYDVR
jgi:UDP-glucose 4-epimerase